MALSIDPVFAITGRTESSTVTAASADLSAPAGAVKLCDVGDQGSLVVGLSAKPLGSTSATVLALYQSHDDGVTLELIDVVAAEASEPGGEVDFGITSDEPLRIEPGESGGKLYVAAKAALAAGWVFVAQVEDF